MYEVRHIPREADSPDLRRPVNCETMGRAMIEIDQIMEELGQEPVNPCNSLDFEKLGPGDDFSIDFHNVESFVQVKNIESAEHVINIR